MLTKEIKFTIRVDEQNLPRPIEWEATDAGKGKMKCNSVKIYLWDNEAQNSMHIDLWTKDMLVQQMNVHYIHNLLNMADSYKRSTGNTEGAELFRQFAHRFAAKTNQPRRR
jgi:gliding motility-associated protein GldC